MKKKLICTLGLGLVIGAMGITSFANEKSQNISDVNLNNAVQNEATFKVLNKEKNQYEQIDNNEYNSNTQNSNNRPQYMNPANCCNYN
ncbi:hypothetical protein [Clostridium sp. CCUG 7971]|uniref:hypothetical protein n=1 Tax=Clostridium sp. CCUG 7971 TaxID=2811414 RepID=UPI001ABB3358|nr:hypothetical protein [Clostridium sp. CCUG 7971]MBO3443774.1 hypothetical protein [Clostridium sp. CCUG 7971]